jgi:hypothetical protein
VEKFTVLGREDVAEPLERILPGVLLQDTNIEILTLLLALSDRPIETAEFDESKFFIEKAVEKGITWEEIIAEEPLVGDHWEEPKYAGSDDDEDWVYETKSLMVTEPPDPTEVKENKAWCQLDEDGITRDTEEFLQKQYWSRRRKYVLVNDDYSPDLGFGGMPHSTPS